VKLGSRSLECSRPLELRLGTDLDGRHDQQPEISEASRDGRPSISVVTPPIPPQRAIRSDDAPEGDAGPDIISASDQRLRKLKTRIISDEEDEKSIRQWRIAVRISKRVSLVELIGKYIEERDARRVVPKKRL
jgi:hypothetical protein